MAIPLLLLVAGAAVGAAVGGLGYSQAKGQADPLREAAQAELDQAEREAASLRAEKERLELQRTAEENNRRHQQRHRREKMRAGYAKSGVLMTGTPENFLVEQARADELNNQEIRRVTKYEKSLLEWNAQNSLIAGENRAAVYENKADNIMSKAQMQFVASIGLSTAGAAFGAIGGLKGMQGFLSGSGAKGAAGVTMPSGATSSGAGPMATVASPKGGLINSLGKSTTWLGESGTLKGFLQDPTVRDGALSSWQWMNQGNNAFKYPWEQ